MNSALPDMMQCLNTPANVAGVKGMEMSILERQRVILNWQQEQLIQVQPRQQQEMSCFSDMSMLSFLTPEVQDFQSSNMNYGPTTVTTGPTLNELLNRPIKADPGGGEYGWMDFEMPTSGVTAGSLRIESAEQVHSSVGYGMNYGISRTTSCPPSVAAAAAASVKAARETKGRESIPSDQKLSGAAGRESFKKRKADRNLSAPKVVDAEDNKSKKNKGCVEEEESKITEQHSYRQSNSSQSNQKVTKGNKKENNESSGCTSKDNSKASEVQKPDVIHVRARRGQATDSHSLAERVRREKISERMKYLQDLVPGCNKITGKAGMLDEIINYVQSLQRQVEFLSMKLAAVNPTRLDLSIDDLFAKEILAACSSNLPTMGVSPDVINPNYLQYNPIEQIDHACGSSIAVNEVDLGLRRSISAPVAIPETFLDTSCFNQISHSLQWDTNIQNIYNMEFQQERPTTFPLHTFPGTIEASSLKMEM